MKKGSSNTTNITIFLLVVVIVLLAVALVSTIQRTKTYPKAETKTYEKVETSSAPVFQKERVIIKVTAKGFEPQSVTVKASHAVIAFQNVDSNVHTVIADPTGQDEFNTGEIAPGETVEAVSYTDAGTYTYSDGNSLAKGVIVVEE
jgi:plastocyanin